jgi:hypothetical protein
VKFMLVRSFGVNSIREMRIPNLPNPKIPCTLRNTVDFSRNHLTSCFRNHLVLQSYERWIPATLAFTAVEEGNWRSVLWR